MRLAAGGQTGIVGIGLHWPGIGRGLAGDWPDIYGGSWADIMGGVEIPGEVANRSMRRG